MTDGDAPCFAAAAWVHARGVITFERPRVMAILNVTPDSFYDGGRLHDGERSRIDAVLEHARRCVAAGADILDIGGESTRPGADPVDPEQERRRVVPCIEAMVADPDLHEVPISIDTRRASVASAALDAGASIVNDVSGLADPQMAAVVRRTRAGVCIGHLRGKPRTMQRDVHFDNVLREITEELAERVNSAVTAGIERRQIIVDPGIGFGKSAEQSAGLVATSSWLEDVLRCPVLIGASRKSFIGALTGGPADSRLIGSVVAAMVAVQTGARVVRVHDVAETVEALAVSAAIRHAGDTLVSAAQTEVRP